MDDLRGYPVGKALGVSGAVGVGLILVGTGQDSVDTVLGMVIAGIGMAVTGIGTVSGEAAGSAKLGIEGNFFISFPNTNWSNKPKKVLAKQHLASDCYVERICVKPDVLNRSDLGVWFRQMETQYLIDSLTNCQKKIHHIFAAISQDVAINRSMGSDIYREITDHI